MSRDAVKAVRRCRIYVEDDMLAMSAGLKEELEGRLVFSGGFAASVPVEPEGAHVRFLSYNGDYLFGLISAAADLDATTAVLDAGTRAPVDSRRFALSRFTYFVIDVDTGLMAAIYQRTAPNAARVLARCLNSLLTPRVWILDEMSDGWKSRLAAMKSAEVTLAARETGALKKTLAHQAGLEAFAARADRAAVTLRFETPSALIPLLERADKALFETLKVRGLNPSGRYDVIDFLKDDMALRAEINLTDAELRVGGWEAVRDKLIAALTSTN
jgi:hypothetical protein